MKKLSAVLLSAALFVLAAPLALADNPPVPAGGTTAAPAGAPQAPGLGGMLMPFALMFGVIYLLVIRPQQKRMKDQQAMLAAIKKDDEILTTSGILGKVTGITDKVVTVEVADNVRVKMLKSQIAQVIQGNTIPDLQERAR